MSEWRLRPTSSDTGYSRRRASSPIDYAERGIVIPMALITRVYLVDDLDGSEDDVSTVTFTLDGKDYEIDLPPATPTASAGNSRSSPMRHPRYGRKALPANVIRVRRGRGPVATRRRRFGIGLAAMDTRSPIAAASPGPFKRHSTRPIDPVNPALRCQT